MLQVYTRSLRNKMNSLKILSRNANTLLFSRSHSFFIRQDLWTPDKIVKSPFERVEVPNSRVTEHVWRNIERWADKTALVCGISNRSYSYYDTYRYSRTFAANLRAKLKIEDGDTVCIMMPNSPEYVIAALGIMEAGAELTTVNPIYTAHELKRQLILSNPKVIIGSNDTAKVIKDCFKLIEKDLPLVIVKNEGEDLPSKSINFHELAHDENANLNILNDVLVQSEDTAIIPYSSGTTGLSKGVELTNRNIVVNCIQQDVEGVKQYEDTTGSHQESIVAVLPFYHIYGLVIVMLHKLSVGAKIVTLPRFQPDSFLNTIRDHEVSILYAAPPLILFCGTYPNCTKDHLKSIRRVVSGAAPLAKPDIIRTFEKMQNTATFTQVYGLTETSPLATAMIADRTNYTSSGFAVSNTEIKVVNSDGRSLGPNEIGELLIRGPHIMKGYRNNPEATKGCITEDGWLQSGDMAFIDKDGSVTIVDRLKELIKVKGFQVPPAELEGLLKEHPSVLDAAVVGIPDSRSGEIPKAFVVLKDGVRRDANDILEFVKERVAEFKRIKEIQFVDSLPKNPSGKLLRRELKEKYC